MPNTFIDRKGQRISFLTVLKLLKKEYGLTCKQVGLLCGVSYRTVEGWHIGREPSMSVMRILADYLELHPLDKDNTEGK